IVATGRMDHTLLADAYERDIRVVQVNRASPDVPYPLVVGDDATGVRESVEHLVGLGHRRLLHISGPPEFTTSRDRRIAFSAAGDAARVEGRVIEATSLTIDAGRASVSEVLASASYRPTAIVAGNDLLALGALRAVRAEGLDCPRDVSVVGFNDTPFAEDF